MLFLGSERQTHLVSTTLNSEVSEYFQRLILHTLELALLWVCHSYRMERGNEVFLLEGKFSCSSDLLSDVKQPHFLLILSLPGTFCEGSLSRALKGISLKYAGMNVPGEAPLFLVTQAPACCFWDSLVQKADHLRVTGKTV